MYLSRIRINTGRKDNWKLLGSPQVIHASVEGCFTDADQTRKLWRLDYFRGQPYLLLLSQERPDFSRFVAQFGYYDDTGEVREYQHMLDCLQNGGKYRFRLCANPVYSLKRPDGERGRVVPHVTVEQQEEWLEKQSEKKGFSLDTFVIVQRELKKFTRQKKYVTLHTATYEGILTIGDVAIFRDALTQGIGRAKSYGCGLLTLARV